MFLKQGVWPRNLLMARSLLGKLLGALRFPEPATSERVHVPSPAQLGWDKLAEAAAFRMLVCDFAHPRNPRFREMAVGQKCVPQMEPW